MSIIKHRFFPRSMFDYDIWQRPLTTTVGLGLGPSTLDLFDPFDALDNALVRNLLWIDQPAYMREMLEPKVPHKYRIAVDCQGYNPKSIKTELSSDKSKLVVSAKEGENKNDDGDYSVKEFRRTYKLPKDVETDKMVSFVTGDGRLVIEFPVKREEKKKNNGEILPHVVDENGKKMVKMSFDVPESIDPNKIKVTCKDRDLIVQAEDKVEKPDGVSQFYYYRRSTLPENTDFNALKCSLDKNVLSIEAPYDPELKPGLRTIPVEMKQAIESGNVQQQSNNNTQN